MKSYFQFTRRQKIGVAALATIILVLVILLNVNYHRALPDPASVDVSQISFTNTGIDSNQLASDNLNFDNSFGANNDVIDRQIKKFDPNLIDATEWEELGFSKKQALAIVQYRDNYGPFENPEDVQKIYVVSEEKFQELRPFMIFENKVIRDGWNEETDLDINLRLVDINSATQEELETIKGIGPVFAKRTIKYRELLGGYAFTNQFSSIYGITDDAYKALKENVIIDQNKIQKIKINTASKEALKKHPYLKDWSVVAAIIAERDKKHLDNLDFLMDNELISKNDLDELLPYISFE